MWGLNFDYVTFQGLFELQTDLAGKFLTSHTVIFKVLKRPAWITRFLRTYRIMCIRRVERNIFQFGATPPKKGHFGWVYGANGESGPETVEIQ